MLWGIFSSVNNQKCSNNQMHQLLVRGKKSRYVHLIFSSSANTSFSSAESWGQQARFIRTTHSSDVQKNRVSRLVPGRKEGPLMQRPLSQGGLYSRPHLALLSDWPLWISIQISTQKPLFHPEHNYILHSFRCGPLISIFSSCSSEGASKEQRAQQGLFVCLCGCIIVG